MRKLFFPSLLVLFTLSAQAQMEANKPTIDEWSYKKNVKGESIQEITDALVEDLDTDKEKAEVIYYWIAHNINYDFETHKKLAKKKKKKKKKKLSAAKQKKKDAKDMAKLLKYKVALKPMYSLLYQKMCEAAGVSSRRVSGWVRTNPKKLRGLGSGHTWNIVNTDEGDEFVDVFMGMGKVDYAAETLTRDYDKTFLFTDKVSFNYTHHPKTEGDQLLETPMNKKEFRSLPVFGKDTYALKIDSLSQKNSFITGRKNENIELSFTFENAEYESLYLYDTRRKEKIVPEVTIDGNTCNVSIFSNKLRSGFYRIFFNEKFILSYRIMVK